MIQSALVLSNSMSLAVSPVLAVACWSFRRDAQPGEVILLHREQDLALSACQIAAPVWLTWTSTGPGLLSNTKLTAAPPLPTPRAGTSAPLEPPLSTEHLLTLCPAVPWGQGCSAINTFPLPSPGRRAAWLGLPTACR